MPFTPEAKSVFATMAALKAFNERKAREQSGKPQQAPGADTREPVEGGEIDVERGRPAGSGQPAPMGD